MDFVCLLHFLLILSMDCVCLLAFRLLRCTFDWLGGPLAVLLVLPEVLVCTPFPSPDETN